MSLFKYFKRTATTSASSIGMNLKDSESENSECVNCVTIADAHASTSTSIIFRVQYYYYYLVLLLVKIKWNLVKIKWNVSRPKSSKLNGKRPESGLFIFLAMACFVVFAKNMTSSYIYEYEWPLTLFSTTTPPPPPPLPQAGFFPPLNKSWAEPWAPGVAFLFLTSILFIFFSQNKRVYCDECHEPHTVHVHVYIHVFLENYSVKMNISYVVHVH